jgi:hypothetical protein
VVQDATASVWRQWARRWWQPLLGIVLAVILFVQVRQYGDLNRWWLQVRGAIGHGNACYLVFAGLLVPLNWGLEGRKWYVLLRFRWPELTFRRVMQAVLAGIAVSLATPNRIGEYGGRALLFPLHRLREVVLSSLVGSWCQWVVFIMLGWPALMYELQQIFGWPPAIWGAAAAIVPLLLAGLLFRGAAILGVLQRWIDGTHYGKKVWWRWLRLKLAPLAQLERQVFWQAVGWATLRFLTYSTQYLLLLWFFGLPLSVGEGLLGIFSIYLVQAGIPLPPGLGVMTRSELAILLWKATEVHPLSVISATFTLYVMNLLLPALPGIWLIVKKKKTQPYNDVYTED